MADNGHVPRPAPPVPPRRSFPKLHKSSNAHNPAILDQTTVLCGWLTKQGGLVKKWQRRWFELKGDQLLYFKESKNKDESTYARVGAIPLAGNRIIERPFNFDDPGRFLFEIIPREGEGRITSNHETFLLCADSDHDRNQWLQFIRRVIYGHLGGGIFGQTLEDTMKFDVRFNLKIPRVVQKCVQFLRKHAMTVEGIFRLPGRSSLIKEIKEKFDRGEVVDLDPETVDIHTVASLLKQYLRDLPDSLINRDNYLYMASIASKYQCGAIDEAIAKTTSLLAQLPVCNYNLLKYLCEFFNDVSKHKDTNKMTVTNLSTVLGPNIARPEDDTPQSLMGTANITQHIAHFLIAQYDELFKMEYSPDGEPVQTDDLIPSEISDGGGLRHKASLRAASYIKQMPPGGYDLLEKDLSVDLPEPLIHSPPPIESHGPCEQIAQTDSPLDNDAGRELAQENSKVTPGPADLLLQVSALKSELSRQKVTYEGKIAALKTHIQQEKLAKEDRVNELTVLLDLQKKATDQSVDRVMDLQAKLQEYQLKFDL